MKFFKAVMLAAGRMVHRLSPEISKKLEPAYPFAAQKTAHLAALKSTPPRVALLSSAGLYLANQQPFQYKNFYGDFSFRVFPGDFPPSSLRLTESDFDRGGFEADPGSLFPLAELKAVAAEFGGCAAAHHYSLLGFCLKPKKLLETSMPLILKTLKEDGTDIILLVPACVVCHEVLPQVAAALEKSGIATVTFAFIPRALEATRGPRTILFDGDCGLPFGSSAVETRKELIRLAIRAAFEMKTAGEVWKFPPAFSAQKTTKNAAAVR
ncbi:MAG: hypothetical protein ACM3YF_01425 [Candidatus Zixiibacteriota bacterium]